MCKLRNSYLEADKFLDISRFIAQSKDNLWLHHSHGAIL